MNPLLPIPISVPVYEHPDVGCWVFVCERCGQRRPDR